MVTESFQIPYLCCPLRIIFEITCIRLFIFGGQKLFPRMEMGGKDFFTNLDWGWPIVFFLSQIGGQRVFLDGQITDILGGVPVNFGQSLTAWNEAY